MAATTGRATAHDSDLARDLAEYLVRGASLRDAVATLEGERDVIVGRVTDDTARLAYSHARALRRILPTGDVEPR